MMRAVDIIQRKRDGLSLSRDEIAGFIRSYLDGDIADYQAAALLMAILLKGMTFEETAALTEEMMRSGEVYELDEATYGRTVDKHSTGGVGDKVSLILAPLAAACGVTVPMVSGRGLGHTGGTLDKLESIPGFRVNLTREEFFAQLKRIRVAMIGQSDNFVPADKRLYALRDVSATVESIPLISASIMSKKIASGAHALVMDVKCGSGAFMQTLDKARELAQTLRGVGEALGRPVRSLITDMNQPLGSALGNAPEVREALECFAGAGPPDLRELTIELTAEMIVLHTRGSTPLEAARGQATRALDSGAAREKFAELIAAQDGDAHVIDDPARLKIAANVDELRSPAGGFVSVTDCREIGIAAGVLGAGRQRTTDQVDHSVGIEMLVRTGDRVDAGRAMARIYHANGRGLETCRRRLANAISVGDKHVAAPPLIIERI